MVLVNLVKTLLIDLAGTGHSGIVDDIAVKGQSSFASRCSGGGTTR